MPYIVDWDPVPGSIGYLVEYKQEGDVNFITPSSPSNPTLYTQYPLNLPNDGNSYIARITNYGPRCEPKSVLKPFTTNNTTTTSTTTTSTSTSSTTTTSTTGVPIVVTEFDDLGSPVALFYNTNDNLMYVLDEDTVAAIPGITEGGVGRFNPSTATGISDFTYVNTGGKPNAGVFNAANNKIYFHGLKTGGMRIYNCSSQTLLGTLIAYGAPAGTQVFTRQGVYLIGTRVYASSTDVGGFVVVETTTDTQLANFVPPNPSSYEAFQLIGVGSELWVYQYGSVTGNARVLIYNASDLSAPIATINDLVETGDFSGKKYGSGLAFDASGQLWMCSFGDNELRAINTSTRTIVHNIPISMEGKDYSTVYPQLHPTSGAFYFSGRLVNNGTEAGLQRTYQIDTSAGTILATFPTEFGSFVMYPPNGQNYVVQPNLFSWNVPNTDFDSDGKIIVYT